MLLIDAFFAFNLVFYAPIMMMNGIIILKELKFEYGEHSRQYYFGGTRDDLKLGIGELHDGFFSLLNLFNPFWWLGRLADNANAEEAALEEYKDSLTHSELREIYNDK